MSRFTAQDVLNHQTRIAVRKGERVEGVGISGRESNLHEQIISELRRRGLYFVHSRMDCASTNGLGTPDFIIAAPNGKTLWIEVKTATGKLSREQAGVGLMLERSGHTFSVVRSFQQFVELVEASK